MKTVVGILSSRSDAEMTVERLLQTGITREKISLLTPDSSPNNLTDIPTTETEQPGMGAAMGGVVGGALGAAGGMGLGVAVASVLVPGVGAVLAIGMGAAALLAAGGAIGGAAAGEALEADMVRGLPIDELFVYEDALRQGRSVVIVFAEDNDQAARARQVFEAAGAVSVDAAKENWWVGIRDDEKVNLSETGGDDFKIQETAYRRGFETALHPANRGNSYVEVVDSVNGVQANEDAQKSFRRGYQRGQAYYRELCARKDLSKRTSSA
jgi:hypothetical protein